MSELKPGDLVVLTEPDDSPGWEYFTKNKSWSYTRELLRWRETYPYLEVARAPEERLNLVKVLLLKTKSPGVLVTPPKFLCELNPGMLDNFNGGDGIFVAENILRKVTIDEL